MNNSKDIFKQVQTVSLQLTEQCNIDCPYCYQDAVIYRQKDKITLPDPVFLAEKILNLFLNYSKKSNFDIVLTGGEPLLASNEWYELFIKTIIKGAHPDIHVKFIIQTNASLVNKKIIELAKKYSIQFSVHFDGLGDNSSLKAKVRVKNIERLNKNNVLMTCLIVGTTEALNNLYETVNFLMQNNIRHYRLNYIADEGRHDTSIVPSSKLRAESEFELAIHASQHNFKCWEYVVLNKFVQFLINESENKELLSLPKPQQCNAGKTHIYINKAGNIFPCSFFSDTTGAIGNIYDKNLANDNFIHGIDQCSKANEFYIQKCVGCDALPICREYCSLTPTSNSDSLAQLCNTQKDLFHLMKENAIITRLVASNFLKYLKNFPEQVPKSCGQV